MIDRQGSNPTARIRAADWKASEDGKLYETRLFRVGMTVRYVAEEETADKRYPWLAEVPLVKECFETCDDAQIWCENVVMLADGSSERARALQLLLDLGADCEMRAIPVVGDTMTLHRRSRVVSELLTWEFLGAIEFPGMCHTRLWVSEEGQRFVAAWTICQGGVNARTLKVHPQFTKPGGGA